MVVEIIIKIFLLRIISFYYSQDAEWHILLSSKGVTANFFTLCREKMRHAGG